MNFNNCSGSFIGDSNDLKGCNNSFTDYSNFANPLHTDKIYETYQKVSLCCYANIIVKHIVPCIYKNEAITKKYCSKCNKELK
jgi:hypothetical protein